jgi:hypothetical protein
MISNQEGSYGTKWKHVETKSIKSFHSFPLPDFPCAKRQGDKPKEGVENDTRNLANGDATQIWTVLKQC